MTGGPGRRSLPVVLAALSEYGEIPTVRNRQWHVAVTRIGETNAMAAPTETTVECGSGNVFAALRLPDASA